MTTTLTPTYTVISTRKFYVTLTGVRGGEFGGDIGPAIVTVLVDQRDGEPEGLPGGSFTASYTVFIDGRHGFGGFAHHLDTDGTPCRDERTFRLGGGTTLLRTAGGMIWHAEVLPVEAPVEAVEADLVEAPVDLVARGVDYAIARMEALAIEADEAELRHLRDAQAFEARGLPNSGACCRRLASEARGKAEGFAIAAAIVAGSFK